MSYESINDEIESATAEDCITQYVALEKVKRILGTNHILLTPQFDNLLNKNEGYVIYNIIKHSEKLGQTDDGKIEWDKPDPENVLYFEWYKNEDTGFYTIFSEIVTHQEATDLINDYHQEISNLFEESTVTLNIPLLLRMLEYSREDAKSDEDLHKATENMIKQNSKVLSMKDYLNIIKND